MGRKAHWKDAAEKQSAYRHRLKEKAEKIRLLKYNFDSYLDEQVSIENAKLESGKPYSDAGVIYSEDQIKTNYLKALNHEPLLFGMTYGIFYYNISRKSWACMNDNCDQYNNRFEDKCVNCGAKKPRFYNDL